MSSAPHGRIQWQGTEVCIDLLCSCGTRWHEDEEGLFETICPSCQQWYVIDPYVMLRPITEQESRYADKRPDRLPCSDTGPH
jgi:hypothetical protein